jgi:hypothetical protein
MNDKLNNTLTLLLAIVLVNSLWILENYWFRWFGLIGYIMIGHNWRRCNNCNREDLKDE